MTGYQPHRPGQQPNKPTRDQRGVQQFGTQEPDPCPDGMIFSPASGECVPEASDE